MFVWLQIDDSVTYAVVRSMPYSRKHVIDNDYQILFDTVVFVADCWE